MKVFDPLRRYSSPSRRAVAAIEPKASEPEPGSVMAQAPTLSSVSRSRAHRSFWAIVPFDMMAALVRPMLTPMAVTMPGECRQISMIGSIVMAIELASPARRPPVAGASSSPAATRFSRSIWALKRSRAMASMPNVAKSFRRMS